VLDDADIGVILMPSVGQFDVNALLHAGTQIPRQHGLELITEICHEGLMDVAPVALQVRIHAGKRTFHARRPPQAECSLNRRYDTNQPDICREVSRRPDPGHRLVVIGIVPLGEFDYSSP
jgi:hypothetical protein